MFASSISMPVYFVSFMQAMRVLVKAGVDPTVSDNNGVTAIKIARDSVCRKELEHEVVEMLENFNSLEPSMEDAAAASRMFHFHLKMCTSFFGGFLIIMLSVFVISLNYGILSEDQWGTAGSWFSLMYLFGPMICLGLTANDVVAIRVFSMFIAVVWFVYAISITGAGLHKLFIGRHEVTGYNRETTQISNDEYRNYTCGADLPALGCGLAISRELFYGVFNFGVSYLASKNIRKIPGKTIYDNINREEGERYDDYAFRVIIPLQKKTRASSLATVI